MSVERQHGKVVFLCDGNRCHESFDTDTTDWNQARTALKEEGWYTTREDGEWKHYCKDCK